MKWEMSRPKDIEPSTFGSKEELWTKFHDDLMDFADVVHPGLKVQLEWTLKQKEEIAMAVLSNTAARPRIGDFDSYLTCC